MKKKYVKSLNVSKMAKRIRERNDNVYFIKSNAKYFKHVYG